MNTYARRAALLAIGILLAVPACSSDDGGDASGTTDPATQVTTGAEDAPKVDASSVKVFTPQEVCDLVSDADMGAAVAGEVTEVRPRDLSTPQCSYNFTTAEGERANLSTSVQRPVEDLGGEAGAAGFAKATSVVLFDTPYEPLDSVGDKAAISASDTFTQVVILSGDQVMTVGGNAPVTKEQVTAAAAMMVGGL